MEILNRKASFNYFIQEEIECGIVLTGTEIKSIREGKANIKDSYAIIRNNECFLLNGCAVGQAKITGAYDLPCEYVIHTVGPVWKDGTEGEADLLTSCYKESLKIAKEKGIRKIAFPSISTGSYNYPISYAAFTAMSAVKAFIKENPDCFDLIEWVLYDDMTYSIYNSEYIKFNEGFYDDVVPAEKKDELLEKFSDFNTKIHTNEEEEYEELLDGAYLIEFQKAKKVFKLTLGRSFKLEFEGLEKRYQPYVKDYDIMLHDIDGLIAGSTGSGKSEFIITYILSMAINYNPNDVAFVLIDYKGGGLAGAFQKGNIKLPHLVGTITNIDTVGLQRSLASIQSELRRRQIAFNKARDITDEGTIDIYKYQKLYHEGAVKKPIPHLIIICDEFAELKQQQPDFMDELISVSRIGRSLGVHLILSTQKPSGIVNEVNLKQDLKA